MGTLGTPPYGIDMPQQERLQLGQFIPPHYHYQMLSDGDRMQAFRRAIELVVRPGMQVADLGSGTGVLSFFAAQCGAQVWALETLPELVQTSRRLLQLNGVADRVTVEEGDAAQWLPPQPVDVVLCEMLHSALLREKQVDVLDAFRRAHLARFGSVPRFLPETSLLGVQPVWQNYTFEQYQAPLPLFQSAYLDTPDCRECEVPLWYASVDYVKPAQTELAADLSWQFAAAAEVNALRFITRNLLATDPAGVRQSVEWYNQHLIVPLPQSLDLVPGQLLHARFAYRAGAPLSTLAAGMHVAAKG
jgi:predicted RNA methylase